jgi:hypothetical protein
VMFRENPGVSVSVEKVILRENPGVSVEGE